MSDTIYRQDAIEAHCELCPDQHICCPIRNGNICPDFEVFRLLPSAQISTDINVGHMISREEAIKTITRISGIRGDVLKALYDLPSAQPRRKTGKWIKLDMHAHLADHKCTACGQECYVPTCMGEPMYTYCPNCGADMRGESK